MKGRSITVLPAISHVSAARFWLGYDVGEAPATPPIEAKGHFAPLGIRLAEAARAIPSMRVCETVHFLVKSQGLRRAANGASCHSVSNPLPHGSLVEAAGLLFVSPELSFVQMSTILPFVDLVRYGSMLCSLFAIDSSTLPGQAITRRSQPITSVGKITGFLDEAPRMNGTRAARAAIPHLFEHARSPLEIDTALHLCLPRCRGGSGLPRPKLNQKIWLDNPVETMDPTGLRHYLDSYECDLVWENAGRTVVVEYQGEAYHSRESSIHRDSVKSNALAAQGVRVFTLTKGQLYDLVQFRRFAESLRKALGAKSRHSVDDFEQRQAQLHARLVRPLKLESR